jgi:hypothetical protein
VNLYIGKSIQLISFQQNKYKRMLQIQISQFLINQIYMESLEIKQPIHLVIYQLKLNMMILIKSSSNQYIENRFNGNTIEVNNMTLNFFFKFNATSI